jgi:hypothetical protein
MEAEFPVLAWRALARGLLPNPLLMPVAGLAPPERGAVAGCGQSLTFPLMLRTL